MSRFFSFLCCRTICSISAVQSIWKEGVTGLICSYSTEGTFQWSSQLPDHSLQGFFYCLTNRSWSTTLIRTKCKGSQRRLRRKSWGCWWGKSAPQKKGPVLWFLSCSYSSSGPVRSELPGTQSSPLAPQSSRWGESDLQKSVISARALELFNFFPLDWLNITARWPGSSHGLTVIC